MPEQSDDHLVPPPKVMRKRLNGVYRADTGFAGPTRRYVLIVALLVGLASVPTLAAITAGSNELADGKTDTMDIPFLPPTSPGPIRSQPYPPGSRPSSPVTPSGPITGQPGADAVKRLGRLLGEAGRRRSKTSSNDLRYAGRPARPASPGTGSSGTFGTSGSGSSADRDDEPSPAKVRHRHRKPRVPGLPAVPDESAHLPGHPSTPARPGAGQHPDDPSDDPSDEPSDDPSDEPSEEPSDEPSEEPSDEPSDDDDFDPSSDSECENGSHCAHHRHRFHDRSEHRRRSAVAERPQNMRPTSTLERSHGNTKSYHGRRLIPEARTDENQIANRSYRGSHRAGSLHHADEQTAAQQRSSRVGRHHADSSEDYSNR